MADIFHEVDEEVRRERLQKLWERYSLYIIAGAVLIVGAIGAWRGYDWWLDQKANEAGAAFEQATTLADEGKHADARAAFDKLAAEAPHGYAVLARMRAAAELADTDAAAGAKAFEALAADSALTPALQDVATVRAAMLRVDTAPLAEMQRYLDALAQSQRSFRHSAREMLALSAWRHGDGAAATRYLDMIANDGETPPSLRSRAEILSALMAAEGKS